MSYQRVIPRDLFNEAKLLKCLGQLALFIHDGVKVPRGLAFEEQDNTEGGFQIEQNPNSGALYCCTLELFFRGKLIELSAPYNSKDAYPLRFVWDDENEGRVFNEDGSISDDFRAVLSAEGVK